MRASLLALALLLLAACGGDEKDAVPQPGTPPPDMGSKADQARDRLREQGYDVGDLRQKMDEIKSRQDRPLTDADVDLYVAVWPDWNAAAAADPEAKRAVFAKHKTDLITWSQVATRVGAAYHSIKTGTKIPTVKPGDVDVVRKRLADIERVQSSPPR